MRVLSLGQASRLRLYTNKRTGMEISSYSMEGEDVILASLFRNVDKGNFFDIGSSEPIWNSNTYFFYKKGWRGVAVDGRDLSVEWEKTRPGDKFVRSLLGDSNGGAMDYWIFPDPTMNTVDVDTGIRYAARFPSSDVEQTKVLIQRAYDVYQENYGGKVGSEVSPPHFVSIDVEGFEISVLRGLLEPNPEWRPAALVVEAKLFNFSKPLENDVADYLINTHAYSLIAKTPLNAFFIDPLNPLFGWLPTSMLQNSR